MNQPARKFARVITKDDPIVRRQRSSRASVTNQSAIWTEFIDFLDAIERKETDELGIAVDMKSPEVLAELRATADSMGEPPLKNPAGTFFVRLRKVLRERQAKNDALKHVRVQLRGSEVALVAGK